MRSAGYIDTGIVAETSRQRAVLEVIRKRGLSLCRVHRDRRALRLSGPGVFLTVADLASISLADLDPPTAGEITALVQKFRK